MSQDKMPKHKDSVESRRHEDIRTDLATLQQAVEAVNSYGMPSAPTFVIKQIDKQGPNEGGNWYITINHNLGYVPDRWTILDINGPGAGDLFALRKVTATENFAWTDKIAYIAFEENGKFDHAQRQARLVFFKGV
jgi:hypothetical protein